jgi:L-threonylcarbamoyladenylate synthase
LSKGQAVWNQVEILWQMKMGRIFVYPTDTVYGMGCNAIIHDSVAKIRELKMRDKKPFSVIAPSKDWIRENCVVDDKVRKWLRVLPGPYTLILKLKNKTAVTGEVLDFGETIGVRIPKHWFTKFVAKMGKPFVTTSVNFAGEKPARDIKEISECILRGVDYIIEDGILKGKPSKIVNLTGEMEIIIDR